MFLLITSVGNNYFSFYQSGFLDYLLYFYCYIPAVITTTMYHYLPELIFQFKIIFFWILFLSKFFIIGSHTCSTQQVNAVQDMCWFLKMSNTPVLISITFLTLSYKGRRFPFRQLISYRYGPDTLHQWKENDLIKNWLKRPTNLNAYTDAEISS